MMLFIQDHSYAGASIVVAENEKEARQILITKAEKDSLSCYFDPEKPFDEIFEIKKGLAFEIWGDR